MASSELVIVSPDAEQIQREMTPLLDLVVSVKVTNKEQHGEALGFIQQLAQRERLVKDMFAEPKQKAHQAHRSICDLEAKLLKPLSDARRLIGMKCDSYEIEQKKIAEEERRRKEAELLKAEEERLLLESIEAEAAGDHEEAEAIAEEPIVLPPVRVEVQTAKVDGISSRMLWKAEVIDMAAFLKFVIENSHFNLVDPNMPALNGLARSLKQNLRIPGVRAVSETVRAVRTS